MITALVWFCLFVLGTICLLLLTVFTIGFTITKWSHLSIHLRRTFMLLVSGQVVLLLLLAYVYWPYSDTAFSQRNNLANEFMTDLSTGSYESALAKITEVPPDEYHGIKNDFSDPNKWPITWDLSEPNTKDIVFGKAVFPDGEELEIVLFLDWEWEKARWGINGVQFGRDIYEGKIRFWLSDTFLPYTWFAKGVLIVCIAWIFFSIQQLRKMGKDKRSIVYFA